MIDTKVATAAAALRRVIGTLGSAGLEAFHVALDELHKAIRTAGGRALWNTLTNRPRRTSRR